MAATYSLTLRGDLDRKLTIEEMDGNFLYIEELVNSINGATAWSGTYSTLDGFIVTVTSGIITNVN